MIVLDASFLIAHQNRRDIHHAAAAEAMNGIVAGQWGLALLPEYVFLEIVTVLMLRTTIRDAVNAGDVLLRAREVELVPSSAVFLDTWRVFRGQPKPRLSFADASILVVAELRGAEAIATFDRNLARATKLRIVPD